ncbi:hypothetical protein [Neptuniibacter marinus]|uniref:hypothetical protein n=1 Tax=Neptuniibacter marinus TaxID=1806670 RepID=UPI003B5AE8DF
MKFKLLSSLSVFLLAGCAGKAMTYQHYFEIGKYANYMDECSKKGYIDHQVYAKSQNALGDLLSRRNVDYEKLNRVANASLSSIVATESTCLDVQLESYKLITKAETLRENQQSSREAVARATRNLNSLNNSLNSYSRSMMDSANSINNQSYNYNTDPYGRSSSSRNNSNRSSSGLYNYYNINGNTVTGDDGTNCFVVGELAQTRSDTSS